MLSIKYRATLIGCLFIGYQPSALAENKVTIQTLNNLAVESAQKGDIKQAQTWLKKALSSQEDIAISYKNLETVNQAIALAQYQKTLGAKATNKTLKLTSISAPSIQVDDSSKIIQRCPKPTPIEPAIKPNFKPTHCKPVIAKVCPKPVACPRPDIKSLPVAAENTVKTPTTKPSTTMRNWAKAWSAQDTALYMSFYSQDYKGGLTSHKAWATQRKLRITKPSYIQVKLKNLRIKRLNNQTAIARFWQAYDSSTLKDTIEKQVILLNDNGQWKIHHEQIL